MQLFISPNGLGDGNINMLTKVSVEGIPRALDYETLRIQK